MFHFYLLKKYGLLMLSKIYFSKKNEKNSKKYDFFSKKFSKKNYAVKNFSSFLTFNITFGLSILHRKVPPFFFVFFGFCKPI
jgi:hypothetical protein